MAGPILAVYRPAQIPDTAHAIAAWREAARRDGIGELLVLNVDVVKEFDGIDRTVDDWDWTEAWASRHTTPCGSGCPTSTWERSPGSPATS